MSDVQLFQRDFGGDPATTAGAAEARVLPFRRAVPLIFALSLGLWAALWQAGALVMHLLLD